MNNSNVYVVGHLMAEDLGPATHAVRNLFPGSKFVHGISDVPDKGILVLFDLNGEFLGAGGRSFIEAQLNNGVVPKGIIHVVSQAHEISDSGYQVIQLNDMTEIKEKIEVAIENCERTEYVLKNY